MTLRLVGSDIVHLDRGTFMWVQVTHFALTPSLDDGSALAELIASPGYAHDYASPLDAAASIPEPAVHGPWYRDRIRPEMFEPWSAAEARTLLRSWADGQDWHEPGYRQPPEVHARLTPVLDLLGAGELFRLRNPGPDAEHGSGAAVGSTGFHEFVVIERSTERIHVIVASDD